MIKNEIAYTVDDATSVHIRACSEIFYIQQNELEFKKSSCFCTSWHSKHKPEGLKN